MKPRFLLRLTFGLAPLFAPAARAVTAVGLSSFEAIEEPLVKFFPATGKFQPDAFVNITDRGAGTFRFVARFNSDWWDGDRDTENKDRQRAEVKGLGPHQKDGDTFVYTTTWRTNPEFRGTAGFCHIFQLKAVNGDSGAPLVTLSLHYGRATVEANPAGAKIVAREFPWKPGVWQTVRLRITPSSFLTGELQVSVDGDAYQGKTGIALARPGADEYRPKWGLYRRAAVNAPMGDDFVEHQDITGQNILWTEPDNAELEQQARALARKTSPLKALEWLLTLPVSGARDFTIASIAALWAETEPAEAMAWTEKLPPGEMRTDAIGRIFARWADQDVGAAMKWLRARAPDPKLDRIVWLFATDTTYRYVQRRIALEAAALTHSEKLRTSAFEHVVEIWGRTEPEAARAFLEKSPALSEEQKRLVAARLPPPSTPEAGRAKTTRIELESSSRQSAPVSR